jgi:hypothetical protein
MTRLTHTAGLLLIAVVGSGWLLRGEHSALAAEVKLAGVPVPGRQVRSLPPTEFEKLRGAVAPGKERWAEIPWETDLAAARARSVRVGKPLLLWVMDGHPLGCT